MNINELMAHAKRAAIIGQAMALMGDNNLEWHEDFSEDIRHWIMQYLSRNIDYTAPEHLSAHVLAKMLIRNG